MVQYQILNPRVSALPIRLCVITYTMTMCIGTAFASGSATALFPTRHNNHRHTRYNLAI